MLSGSEISSIINFVDWNTYLVLQTNLRNKKKNDQLFTTWPSPRNLDQISPFIVFFEAWEHTPCTRCPTGSLSYCWRKLAPVQNIKLLKPLMYSAHFIVGFGECLLQPLDWVQSLIQIIPWWIDLFQSNGVSGSSEQVHVDSYDVSSFNTVAVVLAMENHEGDNKTLFCF